MYSLKVNDFEDSNYTLIGIYTGLEAYKLAYLLNKNLQTLFEISKESLDVYNSTQKVSFSVYIYEDQIQLNKWYLISNKYYGILDKSFNNDLFRITNEVTTTINYLIPEDRNTDYFIKIEGDFDSYSTNKTINSIKKIKQIIATYSIDTANLKSKDFLIF